MTARLAFLAAGISGLLGCAPPQVLRDPPAEPVMAMGPATRNPLPAVAVPTGAPAVERDPAPEKDIP